MSIFESIRVAWLGIFGNKLRSALTMLGVIIGVAAVIALVSVGEGATSSVSSQIEGLGANLIVISAARGSGVSLTLADCEEVVNRVPSIVHAVPSLPNSATVKWQNTNLEWVSIEGTTADYLEVRSRTLAYGRFIDGQDVAERGKVAVVGQTILDDLVSTGTPIGQTISILGQQFTIVGVLAEKGSTMGQDQDSIVLIPITTAQRLFGTTTISSIYAQAQSREVAQLAVSHATAVLEKWFGKEDVVNVQSQDQILETLDTMTQTLSLMLGAIAGISLLVGGIGIMNIMLVSVTERTKEIGTRKAFGAKKWDITVQFLVESIILSVSGGLIGIIFGASGAMVISRLAGWNSGVSITAILVSFLFAASVGLFFGVYPAVKAASLDPIEALRYE